MASVPNFIRVFVFCLSFLISLSASVDSLERQEKRDVTACPAPTNLTEAIVSFHSAFSSMAEVARAEMFIASDIYLPPREPVEGLCQIRKGSVYYLAKAYHEDRSQSADDDANICYAIGGTLAQIDSSEEYDFIEDFLRGLPNDLTEETEIIISGTDRPYTDERGSEGTFRHQATGEFIDFFRWDTRDNEPDDYNTDEDQDCLVLWPVNYSSARQWLMYDELCRVSWKNRVLCEVSTTGRATVA